MKKKIISLLLCGVMVMSIICTDSSIVLAEESTNAVTVENGISNDDPKENIPDNGMENEHMQVFDDRISQELEEGEPNDGNNSSAEREYESVIDQQDQVNDFSESAGQEEGKLVENSWRYKDGKLISGLSRTSRVAGAWSNVDGVFYNDRGNVIEGAVAKGIDVSEHNGVIDWQQVKNSDVDFVIIRCGFGSNTTVNDDKQWLRNISECEKLGIPYGVYLYSYAMSVEAAASEAEHVLRLLDGHKPTYPVFYDLENEKAPYDQSSLSTETLGNIAETFINKVEAAGYDTGVYANKNWFVNILKDSRFNNWDRWVAQYNSVCDYSGDYTIWQCTSSGQIPGISGYVDINFEFSNWKVKGIKANPASPQLLNSSINLSADIVGASGDMKYKYVWMKDNWAEWGVIRDFSTNDSVAWTPDTAGQYTVYLNVSKPGESTVTAELTYIIKDWSYSGIEISVDSPCLSNTEITLSAIVGGETDNLKYKFVWMKDEWSDWGVIKDFSSENAVTWTPREEGIYQLYVNVQDGEGFTSTQQIELEVLEKSWEPGNLESDTADIEIGRSVKLTQNIINVTGDKAELQYKFVWMKDDWAEWGVIRDFSDSNSVDWTPEVLGNCTIFVNLKDSLGNGETVTQTYEIAIGDWEFIDITSEKEAPYLAGDQVRLKTQIDGNGYGLQYKYVWMKDNWADWGVIRDFSESDEVTWTPKEEGVYQIYVNVKDLRGTVITKTVEYEVVNQAWNAGELLFSISNAQAGQEIVLTQSIEQITEDDSNIQYKYVWMKDNWADWGVIKDFSGSNGVVWKPDEPGNYTIYVNLKDDTGNTATVTQTYSVGAAQWKFYDIISNSGNPYYVGETIDMEAAIQGNGQGLRYKYVWMKDNWSKWGVIQDFSSSNSADWTPQNAGTYSIYLDIKDSFGKTTTYVKEFSVSAPDDFYIKLTSSAPSTVGGVIDVETIVRDANAKTTYKYVWMKDNWSEWGVIKDFSRNSNIEWTPKVQGDYTILVDMKREGQSTVTESVSVTVEDWLCGLVSIHLSGDGDLVIQPSVLGNTAGFTYKYVWMKNNWADWGVISDFSDQSSVMWEPKETGDYTVIVNIKDANGNTKTVEANYFAYK